MMAAPLIEQVDAVLCEDFRTVWLHGWTADDTCYLQSIGLPCTITEENFVPDEWKQAARPGEWRLLGGVG